jgi:hypothetical protein
LAIAITESASYTRVTGNMSGLQHTGENYDEFYWYLMKWNGSSWVVDKQYSDPAYDHWGQTAFSYTFTGLQQGTSYYVSFSAKYGGVWYNGYVSGTYVTTSVIPEATFSNESTQKTNIIFNYTNSIGSLTLYVSNGTSWVAIASSGLPYSKTGNTITISSLIPNTSYNFTVKTVYEDGERWSPTTSPGYKTYTTQSWPAAVSAPTLNARVEGGYNLSWGDNGVEGTLLSYALQQDLDTYKTYNYTDNTSQLIYTNDYGVSHSFRVNTWGNLYAANGVQGWYQGNWSTANSFYTAPKTPTGISYSVTSNSITVTATGMEGNYSGSFWEWKRTTDSTWNNTGFVTSGLTETIGSLQANTAYNIRVSSYYNTAGLYSVSSYTTTITTAAPPALGTPTLSSSSKTTRSITFTMATVTNATTYTCALYKAGVYQSQINSSSGTFDELTHNTTYELRLTVSASGYTSGTNNINISTNLLANPSAPTNVSFSRNSDPYYIDASWTYGANSNQMDIDYTADNISWGTVYWPDQTQSSYYLQLDNTNIAYFRIRPQNDDGFNVTYGSWSSTYTVPVAITTRVKIYYNGNWITPPPRKFYYNGAWRTVAPKFHYNGQWYI